MVNTIREHRKGRTRERSPKPKPSTPEERQARLSQRFETLAGKLSRAPEGARRRGRLNRRMAKVAGRMGGDAPPMQMPPQAMPPGLRAGPAMSTMPMPEQMAWPQQRVPLGGPIGPAPAPMPMSGEMNFGANPMLRRQLMGRFGGPAPI